MACEAIQGDFAFGSLSIVPRVVVSGRSKPASSGVHFFVIHLALSDAVASSA